MIRFADATRVAVTVRVPSALPFLLDCATGEMEMNTRRKTKTDDRTPFILDLLFRTLLMSLDCTSIDIAVAWPCSA
jgi:hypothetical protein